MATVNKDFKVKNGINVAGTGIFGGTITAATPTLSTHLATKGYVDTLAGGMVVGPIPPQNASNGNLWFDTLVERVNVYYDGQWITIATIDDTLNIPDHIHDTSIDGNGLIVTRFVDAGFFNEPQGTGIDAEFAFTTDWVETWSGGVAIDNFN